MPVHIALLGERSIVDDADGTVRTRSARTAALVAHLVLHAGVPQSRQHLAAVFWPESTDAQALTNLRRELHTLRQVLQDSPALVVTASDLCWQDTPAVEVDVRSFARERAAALGGRRPRGRPSRPSGTPRPRSATTPATCCPACSTTGCSTPAPTCGASASTFAPSSARPGSRWATRRPRCPPPAGASPWSRSRRPATAS